MDESPLMIEILSCGRNMEGENVHLFLNMEEMTAALVLYKFLTYVSLHYIIISMNIVEYTVLYE